ncbi:hypothetical protein A0H81_12626 [Grifola frondosa]|uniref:Uncharacterized protein n=1 Tax=Grifola frondosa TaxID=5627 RepID=A0A1C7LRE5_GRIFR|nr:hypothetical protein A0H81_12626 [Grifola frondosa]
MAGAGSRQTAQKIVRRARTKPGLVYPKQDDTPTALHALWHRRAARAHTHRAPAPYKIQRRAKEHRSKNRYFGQSIGWWCSARDGRWDPWCWSCTVPIQSLMAYEGTRNGRPEYERTERLGGAVLPFPPRGVPRARWTAPPTAHGWRERVLKNSCTLALRPHRWDIFLQRLSVIGKALDKTWS